MNETELEEAADYPLRVEPRLPGEEDPLPIADAVLAAPLSFNTLNKWATGISDTLALGLLNELLGAQIPIVAAPCAKAPLQRHPVYAPNVKLLEDADVSFLNPEQTVLRTDDGLVTFNWPVLVDAITSIRGSNSAGA